jgi:hypothetical protein
VKYQRSVLWYQRLAIFVGIAVLVAFIIGAAVTGYVLTGFSPGGSGE